MSSYGPEFAARLAAMVEAWRARHQAKRDMAAYFKAARDHGLSHRYAAKVARALHDRMERQEADRLLAQRQAEQYGERGNGE